MPLAAADMQPTVMRQAVPVDAQQTSQNPGVDALGAMPQPGGTSSAAAWAAPQVAAVSQRAPRGAGLAKAALVVSFIAALAALLGACSVVGSIALAGYVGPDGGIAFGDVLSVVFGMVMPYIPSYAINAFGYLLPAVAVTGAARNASARGTMTLRVLAVLASAAMLYVALSGLIGMISDGALGNLVNMLAGYAYTNAPDAIMRAILTSLSACAMFPVYLFAMPASILSMVAAFRIKATN